MEAKKPVLVTLTSPTAAGKSYLFNYIRDVAKLPCLISTTTRRPRANEVEGVDYYFISEEESKAIEARNEFAELAIYRGIRYGVTRKEYFEKLSNGIAFLIVEPSGIEHYAQPAIDSGALHLKFYIHTNPEIRIARFKTRVANDIWHAMNVPNDKSKSIASDQVQKIVAAHFDRFNSMLTEELDWGTRAQWDRTLFGEQEPAVNLKIMLDHIAKAQK